MSHPFRVREIAVQAGLSEATVDRVLNRRGGVRASTVDEVHRAVEDLQRQRSQLRLTGRTFLVDVVVDAPERFSSAVRAALEAELPGIRPAVIRSRFHLREAASAGDVVAILDHIGARGSSGVVLKAADVPEVNLAVSRLVRRGVPVVTLVTDLPVSGRLAYVGIDNRAAGATAAYLVAQWLGERPGAVLVTRGDGSFRGEDEREMGFRSSMRALCPGRRQVELINPEGGDDVLHGLVRHALGANGDLAAVYSMYAFGGNEAILDAFAEAGRRCEVFVAHDLDAENLRLLSAGRLSAVLHHDLRQDLRHACLAILRAHRALPGAARSSHSAVQVVTPHNLPPGLLPQD